MEKNKSKEKKTDKWSEEVEQLLKKSGGNIENLEAADRDRLFNLLDKISDEIRKAPSLTEHIHECKPFSQEQKEYLIRASLFLYAQNYVNIVQSVTSQPIGWIDPELNGYYQQTVIAINHLLGLDECKDFPGGFEPFNDNIFPESGILDIGWEYGFADSCVDFLSRAQQFFLDTQTLSGDTSFLQAYVEWLKSKHVSVAKKADEYGKKARQMWRGFEKKHFGTESKTTVDKNINKETTPPKESIIHKHKKPMEAGQENEDVLQLTKAERLAYQSYDDAITQEPKLADATDKEVYDWLKENGPPDYELPSCETWKRQVRAGRKHHGTQKNTLRAGRTSKSIVGVNQIEYGSSQKAD